jgi:hypothetical protein
MPRSAPVFKATELVDIEKLSIILDNWEEIKCRHVSQFETDENPMDSWKDGNGKEYDPRTLLRQYQCKMSYGKVRVDYTHSTTTHQGRKFAMGAIGLQSFARPIRHTLAGELYKDVDMVNCHPVLLVQYCEKKGYACEHIKSYVENRAKYLEDLMNINSLPINKKNKEWAKKIILVAINGSMNEVPKSIRMMNHKPKWFDDFYTQMSKIKEAIAIDPENAELLKVLKRRGSKINNLEGSLLNHTLCRLEDSILMKCMEYMEDNGLSIKNVVLCFDGFMIPKGINIELHDLEKYILEKTQYDVKFDFKPMDETINLTGLTAAKRDVSKSHIIKDDYEGATILVEKLKDDLRVSPNNVYIRDGFIWTSDEERVKTLMRVVCMRLNLVRLNAFGDETAYSTNKSGRENIVSVAMDLLKATPNPNFEDVMFKSTLNKVCFQNGVYNFQEHTFTTWKDVRDVYTPFVIPRDYKLRDEVKIREVYQKVFMTIFENKDNLAKEILSMFANALSGAVNEKYMGVCLGHRSSGKGVLTDLCQNAFGNYTGTIMTGNLMMSNDLEPERKYGCLLSQRWARLIFGNEAKMDEGRKDCSYDGNFIKSIQGGDKFRGRMLHKNPVDFYLQGKMILMINDMPKFQPADCLEAMEFYEFPYKFVSEENMDEKEKLPYFRQADPDIKNYIRNEDVGMAFFHLLTDYYAPVRVVSKEQVASKRDVLMDCGCEETIFKNTFKIVSDKSAYVESSAVAIWVKEKGLNMSAIKVKKMLVDMGAEYNTKRRINGRQVAAYYGIVASFRKKANDNDNDSDIED